MHNTHAHSHSHTRNTTHRASVSFMHFIWQPIAWVVVSVNTPVNFAYRKYSAINSILSSVEFQHSVAKWNHHLCWFACFHVFYLFCFVLFHKRDFFKQILLFEIFLWWSSLKDIKFCQKWLKFSSKEKSRKYN